jgi:formiminotetrahydrofolate cyclodeaminase
MKLADMQVTQFCDVLASDAPAPGGGSTAALEGALGAALTAMVCGLTTVGKSREKYAEYQEFVLASQKKALDLKARFVDVMDRDTEAFNVVSAAFGMPKATDEEKAARSAAIQKGLEGCTRTPFEMMELAAETLELTAELLGKTNDSAASDLGGHSRRVAQCADQYRQPEEQGAGRGLPQEGRGASGEGSAPGGPDLSECSEPDVILKPF